MAAAQDRAPLAGDVFDCAPDPVELRHAESEIEAREPESEIDGLDDFYPTEGREDLPLDELEEGLQADDAEVAVQERAAEARERLAAASAMPQLASSAVVVALEDFRQERETLAFATDAVLQARAEAKRLLIDDDAPAELDSAPQSSNLEW